jgi:ribose transport system permease protein
MAAFDRGGARMTVSEGSHRSNTLRAASSGRGLRAVAPALLIVFSLILIFVADRLAPGFATATNILQLLKLASFLGLAAIGQTIVMLTGGIDLSIAWVLTASAVVFTGICNGQDANIIPAAAAAISVGLVTGLFNGFGVVKLRISPIVMTLATNNIMLGATLIYTGGTPSGSSSSLVRALATGDVGVIPAMVILWCLLAILTIVAVRYSRGGRMLLAVGENPRVSYLTGILNGRVIIAAYVVCGLTTSITGILFAAFSGASFLGMGDQFVLPTVAAVVLGGTSMFGGRGGYGGTMAAVFFTTILTTVLVIGNIPQGVRNIVFGVAILAAILAQRFLTRREDREQ